MTIREKCIGYLEQEANAHRQLADDVCDDNGRAHHIECARLFAEAAYEIARLFGGEAA